MIFQYWIAKKCDEIWPENQPKNHVDSIRCDCLIVNLHKKCWYHSHANCTVILFDLTFILIHFWQYILFKTWKSMRITGNLSRCQEVICFISCTVRMPAIKNGPWSLLLYCWRGGPVNTVPVICLCYRVIFYNFYIGLDCFSRTKHHIKIGNTWQKPK